MKFQSLVKTLLEKAAGVENLDRTLAVQAIRTIDKVSHQRAAELAANRFARPKRYPQPDAERNLERKGTRIEFKCGLVGHKFGSGPAILLVHGWGGRGLQLGALIDPLVKNGFSVVSLDGPAHGQSPGTWTSPSHFAVFLKTVALELGPLKAIVAHSFGAGTTILAMDNGLETEKAILVAPPNRYGQIVERYCDFLGLSAGARHIFYQLVTYRVGISARDFLLENYFKRIKQPVMLIHDKNDKELSFSEAEALALCNPNAKLILTEGYGHRRILKSDILINKCLEFIS